MPAKWEADRDLLRAARAATVAICGDRQTSSLLRGRPVWTYYTPDQVDPLQFTVRRHVPTVRLSTVDCPTALFSRHSLTSDIDCELQAATVDSPTVVQSSGVHTCTLRMAVLHHAAVCPSVHSPPLLAICTPSNMSSPTPGWVLDMLRH